jgi:hypothetical protein
MTREISTSLLKQSILRTRPIVVLHAKEAASVRQWNKDQCKHIDPLIAYRLFSTLAMASDRRQASCRRCKVIRLHFQTLETDMNVLEIFLAVFPVHDAQS